MKALKLIAISLMAASCTHTTEREVGQYVYVDCFNTIHVDRECASRLANNPKTKEERMANMQGVTYIDTCNIFMYGHNYRFCPKCTDDNIYRQLNAIMERNQKRQDAMIEVIEVYETE